MTIEQHQRTGQSEILTIRQGLVAGVVAAMVMAVVAMGAFYAMGKGPWIPINAIGTFFLGGTLILGGPDGIVTVVGVIVQLLVGGLLGMLYASAQSPEDTPSLIVIGLFYGLVTYIVSRIALRWLNPAVFAVWRTWPIFAGQLLFGATLAVFAALRNPLRRRAVKRS